MLSLRLLSGSEVGEVSEESIDGIHLVQVNASSLQESYEASLSAGTSIELRLSGYFYARGWSPAVCSQQ